MLFNFQMYVRLDYIAFAVIVKVRIPLTGLNNHTSSITSSIAVITPTDRPTM